MKVRPKACGPDSDTERYMRWKIYGCQLWRFGPTWDESKIKPIEPWQYIPGDHKTPPRRKDTVLIVQGNTEKFGRITWIDYESDEANVVVFKDNIVECFPLDLFETNRGKIRWRVEL